MADQSPVAPAGASTALEGGSYEVIRKRLIDQAEQLGQKAEDLNTRRKQVFGGSELALIATERLRTEHNCIPRDIVSIRGKLLVGYLVFIGLKSDINVPDIFSLNRFVPTEDGFDLSPIPLDEGEAFLADPGFVKEFKDLYR